jgi:Predicted pyridoxal phosphate-dependent enzyme apparently involved in regulation of cell wall biogenesis
MTERITYARAVHGEEEIEAVVRVLRSGHQGLRIGRHVAEMERRVAALSGKALGVMCNSGSSALYLAVELLELPPGSEVITSPLTFSTDVAPIVRAGLVPVFVDVEPDTYNVDVSKIEEMVTDRTRALRSRTSPATPRTGTPSASSPTATT